MAEKPTASGSAEEKQEKLRETREVLEQLGVPEARVPGPDPESLRDGVEPEAPADGPEQASVQPGAASIKGELGRQLKG